MATGNPIEPSVAEGAYAAPSGVPGKRSTEPTAQGDTSQ